MNVIGFQLVSQENINEYFLNIKENKARIKSINNQEVDESNAVNDPNIIDILGNIFDWVPILEDEEKNYILRKNNQYALATFDDHSRCGIIVVNDTFEELKKHIDEATKWFNSLKPPLDGWKRFYNLPILKVVEKYGGETHFG